MVLDILFVACFRWNVSGAAIATVFSQAAMTLFLIAYSARKYPLLRFSLRGRLFHREALTDGIHFGFPPMLQSSVSSAGSLILQNFMNGFGSQTVAAVTTAYRVDSVVMLPIINLGSGISTLTAQQYGAGNQKEARRIFSAGLFVMSVTALLLTALVIPSGGHLIALFGAGAEAVSIGERFFRRIAAFIWSTAFPWLSAVIWKGRATWPIPASRASPPWLCGSRHPTPLSPFLAI